MSTATTQRDGNGAETRTRSPLDAALNETQRRQSLVEEASVKLGVPAVQVYGVLRNMWTVTKGQPELSDREVFMGLAMIAKYDLDPFAREIYVARDGRGKLMIIIGVDGWIKIVHRTGDYDGHEQCLGFDDSGELEFVDTVIYSKSRAHPTTYRAFAKEYATLGGFMRDKIPWHMLRIFGFKHAARFFSPLGSVYTEEEAYWMKRDSSTAADAPAESLNALAESLEAKASEPEEPPPPAVAGPTVVELAEMLKGCSLKRDCDAVAAQYPNDATVARMCEARWQEIKAARGQGSNKPKPEVAENPPAGDGQSAGDESEASPEVVASASRRDSYVESLKTATREEAAKIEEWAIEEVKTGDLLPVDCEAVTSACRQRLKEMG